MKWRCVSTSGEACLVVEVEVRFNEWRGVSRRVEDARFEARCNRERAFTSPASSNGC